MATSAGNLPQPNAFVDNITRPIKMDQYNNIEKHKLATLQATTQSIGVTTAASVSVTTVGSVGSIVNTSAQGASVAAAVTLYNPFLTTSSTVIATCTGASATSLLPPSVVVSAVTAGNTASTPAHVLFTLNNSDASHTITGATINYMIIN